ncbi:hypothetical protein BDQ17DRAFT_1434508 [Cyathus striatus]|nr:hypothetical protein BDQ17DRAFT_1434508 [Cyathus striatus]
MALLIFYLILSSFTFQGVDINAAQRILEWNSKRYPNGELFLSVLWLLLVWWVSGVHEVCVRRDWMWMFKIAVGDLRILGSLGAITCLRAGERAPYVASYVSTYVMYCGRAYIPWSWGRAVSRSWMSCLGLGCFVYGSMWTHEPLPFVTPGCSCWIRRQVGLRLDMEIAKAVRKGRDVIRAGSAVRYCGAGDFFLVRELGYGASGYGDGDNDSRGGDRRHVMQCGDGRALGSVEGTGVHVLQARV